MKTSMKAVALTLIGSVLLLFQPAGRAQEAAPAEEAASTQGFTAAQLEQLVAPVALYPDSLLMQVYMAATYPLEVVQADRWIRKNSTLSTEAVDEALKGYDWDISVKSLCHLPDVLERMADNLDWTQDVGDAFLSQEADLLDATQRMRLKAYEEGNLKTTPEQTVTVKEESSDAGSPTTSQEQVVTVKEEKIIVIQPSDPQVVYVPTYNPTVVYGPAWYPPPYYPGMYYYPPGAALFTFAVGVAVGHALWGHSNWGWGHSHSSVNVNIHNNFNRNTNANWQNNNLSNRSGENARWNHNPEHRKGVGYGNSETARQYGASGSESRVTRDQARGYAESQGTRSGDKRAQGGQMGDRGSQRESTGSRQASASGQSRQGTASGQSRQGTASGQSRQGMDRASTQQRQRDASKPSVDRAGASSQGRSKDSAFSGAGRSGSMERSSSQRGSASRSGTGGTSSRSRSGRSTSGGAKRGGGGGRR